MHRSASLVIALFVIASITGIGVAGIGTHGDVATAQATCEFPTSATDATGEDVTIEEEPQRIVALQPSDAQTLWAIGAQEKVVGMPVGQYTSYLEGYSEPQDITTGDGITVSTERVVALEPDVVLAGNVTSGEQIQQLRNAGLTVYQYDSATSIEDVIDNTETTGQLAGACQGAQETVDWMNQEIEAVEQAVDGQERPTVLYAMGDGYTAGSGTFINEVITTAGGENLAAAAGIQSYGQISEEVVLAQDPDWIVYPDTFEEPPVSEQVLSQTTAGQQGQVVQVDANQLNQPGPQVIYAIQNLAETFHPDAYTAPSDGTANESNRTTGNGTTGGDTVNGSQSNGSATGGSEGQPGFGVTAAAVALVAAALLALRRR